MLEELKYREEQYNKNPNQELRYYFSVCNNLSELYIHLDNLSESHKYLDKALSLLSALLTIYDESSLEFDKMNLHDVASQLYYKEGNMEQARMYATQCLESYNNLPDELKEGHEELVQRNQEYLKE